MIVKIISYAIISGTSLNFDIEFRDKVSKKWERHNSHDTGTIPDHNAE
jgi:hypothetical protein